MFDFHLSAFLYGYKQTGRLCRLSINVMLPHLIIIIASGGVLPFFLTSVAGGFTLLIYNNRNVMVKKVKSLGGYRFFLLYLHVFKFIAEQIN